MARVIEIGFVIALLLTAGTARAEPVRLVVVGDSLSAGYGLAPEDAFPIKLEAELKKRGLDVTVVNAGVSGDTSTGGLARLDWSVEEGTEAVVLELGGNDALRGIDPAETRKSLREAVRRLKERGIAVLIAGMRAPPNMGDDYTRAFDAIYPGIAREFGVALYPFFLEGVAAVPALNLPDGVHPNAEGIERIAAAMAPAVETLLAAARPPAD